MTHQEFTDWMERYGLTDQAAANVLGISISSVRAYRRGFRHDQESPIRIPQRIADRTSAYKHPSTI